MAADSAEKHLVRQGWTQTIVTIVVLVASVFVAYGNLKATADSALEKATEAKNDAASVSKEAKETKEAFLKAVSGLASDVRDVRTILNERLPKGG